MQLIVIAAVIAASNCSCSNTRAAGPSILAVTIYCSLKYLQAILGPQALDIAACKLGLSLDYS